MSHAQPVSSLQVDSTRSRVPLWRLVKVEVRKSFDTRAGRWYSASILLLCLAAILIYSCTGQPDNINLSDQISLSGTVLGYFLPIIPIMLITQEWGQRTALTTFTLEPRRSRIIVAKVIASLLIAIAVMVMAYLFAAFGTLIIGARGGSPSWGLHGTDIRAFVLANLLGILIGVALGTLLLNTAAAIVGYFVWTFILPIAFQVLGNLMNWFQHVGDWINLSAAESAAFGSGASGKDWAHFAVAGTIWVIIPLVFGLWRILRAEVK